MKISSFWIPKITQSINSDDKEEMKGTLKDLKQDLLKEAANGSKAASKSQQRKK